MTNKVLVNVFAGVLLCGCNLLGGGLHVEPIATTAQAPGNVAVYVTVADGDKPVTGLNASDFKIYEDGQEVTKGQSQQTLLPRDSVAVHRTLLLVDMSGSITAGQTRTQIATATIKFVSRLRKNQPVTVYAFDGGTHINLIGEFPKVAQSMEGAEDVEEIEKLENYTSTDPSSNLRSAVVDALKRLDTRLNSTAKPVRVGTLVVFLRGPDLAGRVEEHEMQEALDETKHRVYAIGLEDSNSRPGNIGRDATFMAPSMASLGKAFDDAATRIEESFDGSYLLAYCSPARGGERTLRIEVSTDNAEGEEIRGDFRTEFDATGFGAGCSPTTTPRFTKAWARTDEEEEDKDKDRPARSRRAPAAAPAGAAPQEAPPKEKPAAEPPPESDGYAP